jgi:hypothetical protein
LKWGVCLKFIVRLMVSNAEGVQFLTKRIIGLDRQICRTLQDTFTSIQEHATRSG